MGGELLDDERVYEGNDRDQPSDDQNVREHGGASEAAAGEESPVEEGGKELNLVEALSTTVRHFFPQFNEWLGGLSDRRNQKLITYCKETLLWAGLIVLLTKQGARRQVTYQMREERFCGNVAAFSGQEFLDTNPHGDTLEYCYRRMKPDEVEEVQVKLIQKLVRGQVLKDRRLLGIYYMVAMDGVHTHSYDYPHCSGCLVKEDDKGNKTWMHYELQASLVTEDGLCLPMAREWIENEAEYKKQDCEIKAAKRLIAKIRQYYPKLKLCMMLDALYCCAPIMQALDEAKIEWMIVFKKGSMPEVWEWIEKVTNHYSVEQVMVDEEEKDIETRRARTHGERLVRTAPRNEQRRVVKRMEYRWMPAFEHWDGLRTFNVLRCKEIKDGKQICSYTWLLSKGLKLNELTVKPLSRAGRCRWKIENEGNNIQKHGGYGLEHLYSHDEVSQKVWYALINIAHTINQLLERGSLVKARIYGGYRDLSQRLFEHFRYLVFRKPEHPPRIQIRLCWDSS